MYDVIIIGAGVSGAATARELSRYKVKACVIEKEEDVCHLRKMALWLYVCMRRICRIFKHCMTEVLQMVLRS